MIMLVNPIIGSYWFSILLGWIAKMLVTKYGNKETHSRIRYGFIGLIVGELFLCALSLLLSLLMERRLVIHLNRNY